MILNYRVTYALLSFLCLKFTGYCASGDGNHEKQDRVSRILLKPDPYGFTNDHPTVRKVLDNLHRIYSQQIRPVEQLTKYGYLYQSTITDADLYANPVVLVVGPWSTGKSTLINHLIGIEHEASKLYIGAEPTTADFAILTHGKQFRSVDGSILTASGEKLFKGLRKLAPYDQLKRIVNLQIPSPLLRNLTFVDTPGILEHRRLRQRGYPYDPIMHWFVDKAQLVLIVFDPTKLDVGREMESLSKWLRGKESLVRIVLNKADSVTETQLMRVYGALFWSLSPLFNTTEAPRVYVSSFKSDQYMGEELEELFEQEELHLLYDIYSTILNRIPDKIAKLRAHAVNVRAHALLLNEYVKAYRKNSQWFSGGKNAKLVDHVISNPDDYEIYEKLHVHVPMILNSINEAPLKEVYRDFFMRNSLERQEAISEYKPGVFGSKGDLLKKINKAIDVDLPHILRHYQKLVVDVKAKLGDSKEPPPVEIPHVKDRKKSAFREHFETFQPKYSSHGFEEESSEERKTSEDQEREEYTSQRKEHVTVISEKHPPKPKIQPVEKPATSVELEENETRKTERILAAKCPKYRKTCEVVTKEAVKVKDAEGKAAQKPKCARYRKSCIDDSQKIANIKHEKTILKSEPVQVAKKPVEASGAPIIQPVRCPIYRKTCNITLAPVSHVKLDFKKDESEPKSETKCIIYRKSCTSKQADLHKPPPISDREHEIKPKIEQEREKGKSPSKPTVEQMVQEDARIIKTKYIEKEAETGKTTKVEKKEKPEKVELEESEEEDEVDTFSTITAENVFEEPEPAHLKPGRRPKFEPEIEEGSPKVRRPQKRRRGKYNQHATEKIKEILEISDQLPFLSKENVGYADYATTTEEPETTPELAVDEEAEKVEKIEKDEETEKEEEEEDEEKEEEGEEEEEISTLPAEPPLVRRIKSEKTVSVPPTKLEEKVPKHEPTFKCPKYRKTCEPTEPPKQEPDKLIPVSVISTVSTDKCILYRKSCKTESGTILSLAVGDKSGGQTEAEQLISQKKQKKVVPEQVIDRVKNVEESVSLGKLFSSDKKTKKSRQKQNEEETQVPTGKCAIYRKSCTPDEKGKTTGTDFFDFGSFTEKLVFLTKLMSHVIEPQKKTSSCPKYRKSCKPDKTEDYKKPPVIQIAKEAKAKKSTQKVPLRKEKAVEPSDRSEEAVLEKTTPSEREKCLLYRKSCQAVPVPEKPVSWAKLDQLSKQQQKSKDEKILEKCPPYRKSCRVPSHRVPSKLRAEKSDISKKKEEKSTEPPGTTPCPVYRKSCVPAEVVKTNTKEQYDETDHVYILDQDTGKVKRYCRKKPVTAADSRSDKRSKELSLIQRLVRYLCS